MAIAVFSITAAWAAPTKYALLIGINRYAPPAFRPLTGCLNDIHLMRDILVSSRFGFPPENITLLTDAQATHLGIKNAFQDLETKLSPGDIVYIHYSGHGSFACDLSGTDPTGIDQTLVGYGSRSAPTPANAPLDCAEAKRRGRALPLAPPASLDEFDILDKELNTWLWALAKKTDNIVFVSDSCHSGTNTRGLQARATRGVAPDLRPHPLETMVTPEEQHGTIGWLAVAAARDNEKASQYRLENGQEYGALTWFWAKALAQAGPTDTWADVFHRTTATLATTMLAQHPQMEGNRDRLVFGGNAENRPRTFTVAKVSASGRLATIDAGSLLGIGVGSVFRQYTPQTQEAADLPRLTVTEVSASRSIAAATGAVRPGDALVLERWQPARATLKVFLRAEAASDQPFADRLKTLLGTMPAFTLVDSQADCDIVLWLLRPQKDAYRKPVFANPQDSLPVCAPDAKPEVWVLDPGEHLLDGQENLRGAATEAGLETLQENLRQLAGLRGMLELSPPPGSQCPLDVQFSLYAPASAVAADDGRGDDLLPVNGQSWKRIITVTAQDLQQISIPPGRLVLVTTVTNRSDQDYYVYAVNVTLTGGIKPFVPNKRFSGDCLVAAGQTRVFRNFKLLLTDPVEHVRILGSLRPLDIFVVSQDGYRASTRGGTRLDPLAAMLANRAGQTRSGQLEKAPLAASDWTTLRTTFVRP